jgi:NAD(P)-dependent dehydrogenase (short-subunit alcohol dehydrogenase family)
MDLSGRRAILAGGAGHIGLAAAETLIELGANVAILDQDKSACENRVAALSHLRKDSAVSIPCDLRDEDAQRNAVKQAVDHMGGLDILVHCAAYVGTDKLKGWAVPFEEQTVEAWDLGMRVNLTSAFIMTQEAQEALKASGHGSIIVFASIHGVVAPDFTMYEGTEIGSPAGYAASKGGLIQLMRYLSTALAPDVRVNAITPGGVWRDQPEPFHLRYISRTPLRRMAVEEDLKGAVAFLSSDMSNYVTGHNLVVDGGWLAW